MGESGTEVSYLISEPRKFAEVTRLSEDTKKTWQKNLKEIKNLTNNNNFAVQDPEKGEPVSSWIYVYRETIQSDGSLDKIKLRILVIVDLKKSN